MSRVRWWDSDDLDSSAEFSAHVEVCTSGSQDDHQIGTDVDGRMDDSTELRMETDSPSSELDKLNSGNTSDNESLELGKCGSYDVNPETKEPTDYLNGVKTDSNVDEENNGSGDTVGELDKNSEIDKTKNNGFKEPKEKKIKHDRRLTDSVLLEKHSNEGGKMNESFSGTTGSRPGSAASSTKSGTPGKEKDPLKREKDKEREDRIRQAQQKLQEERHKKIEEMREQQRLAQENREKQLEARRKKIEELKKREEERRKQVEDRRRVQEETDRVKKEAILNKAKERLTRYEQWKTHGRKGGRRHVLGFGSRTPREVCFTLDARRSSSQSTLRRSPNSVDYDSYFNRRAVSASSVVRRHCCIDINKLTQGTGYPGDSPPSKMLSKSMGILYQKGSPDFSSSGTLDTSGAGNLKSGAESMMALHTIPENRLGRSIVASAQPSRHKSAVNLSGVKMRDPLKTSPRKPRPSSVATSMPSFVRVETDSPKSARSKSSERGKREASRGRVTIKTDDDKTDGKERKAATLPRPYDRKKIEERRQEVKKKTEERKEQEKEKEKERMVKSEIQQESKDKDKPPPRLSKSFIERMAHPKHPSQDKKEPAVREATPVKVIRREGPVEAPVSTKQAKTPVKDKPPMPQRESPAKPAGKVTEKTTDTSSETKSDTPKSMSPTPSGTPPARGTPTIQVEEGQGSPVIPTEDTVPAEKPASPAPEEQPAEPEVSDTELEAPKTPPKAKPEPKPTSPEPAVTAKVEKVKTDKEREMDEYKAKLAEKRRLAREKAEREAEIERLRQEELQRQEEEREREEEERQRREEEEALRLAAEARQIEEERLARAIEAEDKRKREEAERQEQERIAKEEAERKAREEAEKREKEMQERARREEEERIERKKRLEMIMKRVKTDTPTSTPEKTRTESPTRVVTTSSSRTSLVSSEDEKTDEGEKEDKSDMLKPETEEAPKFKSPLLQKLAEGKMQDGESGTPKFKSPLLQSIMSKTKSGSRLSGTRLDEMDRSTDSLVMTKSSDDLSEKEKTQDSEKEKDIIDSGLSNGVKYDSTEKLIEDEGLRIRSHVDSYDTNGKTVIDDKDRDFGDSVLDTDSQTLAYSTADSALSLSFNGIGVSSHNGDLHIEHKEQIDPRDLVDSSISVRTVDSLESPQTGTGVHFSDSQSGLSSESTQFEEIIDLTNVSTKPLKLSEGRLTVNHSDDLFGLNNLDNGHVEEDGNESSHPLGKPIIAFEDNATRQDVPDLLS